MSELVGNYRIIGAYPHGGYRALDIIEHARVHLEVFSADDWRERTIQILRAASIAGALQHAGIARIHGRGVLPDRRPWVASELAEGVALSDVIARRALAVEEAVALVRDLTEIAAHAHARRIIHGAIRPHLVTLRTGEKPFPIQVGGWADLRAPGAAEPPAQLNPYMAPELIRGAAIDAKIDIYAIGAIVYRGLTNRFPGTGVAEVPATLGTLLTRMLEPDPAQRMSAVEVRAVAMRLAGDRVRSGPRFASPRWTPAPQPDGERVANIIDLAAARRDRS